MEIPELNGGLPSGKRLQFAMENGPVEIVDLPIDSMVDFFIVFLYVYQRVNGKKHGHSIKMWDFPAILDFQRVPKGTKNGIPMFRTGYTTNKYLGTMIHAVPSWMLRTHFYTQFELVVLPLPFGSQTWFAGFSFDSI